MSGRVALAALMLVVVAGCSVPPMATTPPAPGMPRDTALARGTTSPGGAGKPATTPGVPAVVVDSLPSPDAQAVLATIPEPLPPSQRVPAPNVPAPPADTASSAPDSAIVDSTAIPVPAPTPVLGETPAPTSEAAGAAGTGAGASGAAPGPAAGGAPSHAGAAATAGGAAAGSAAGPPAAGPCWRVQVVAPTDKETGTKKREAAESLLLVSMTMEYEGKLYKVRTRECYDRATAETLRGRAVDSGFPGAFLLEVNR